MSSSSTFTFTHNAMESGVATCDPDVVNENMEHLKDIQDQKEDISPAVTTLASSGTINLADNKIYKINPTSAITFVLPVITDNTSFHQIMIQAIISVAVNITWGTTDYFNKVEPDLSQVGRYNIYYEWDGTSWVVGSIIKGAGS